MKDTDKILFIGGDMRQIRAINEISKLRNTAALGFEDAGLKYFNENVLALNSSNDINETFKTIIFPLPYTVDGENINTPFSKSPVSVTTILKALPPKCNIFAGKCDDRLKALAEVYEANLVDYFDREELQVLNAIPTAEGAIQIAMQETKHTLHNSQCLVIGNGRIGKILAKMLHGIGAKVTVSARKQKDLAQIQSFGYSSIPLWKLHDFIGKFDVIFNTVPVMILDADLISKINKNCVVIDLASKPGGVDFEIAYSRDLKVIWALSLPGKVAPDTAGDIIKDTIINILNEMEV